MSRTLKTGENAKNFYRQATHGEIYSFQDNKYKGIGGYWREGNKFVAYDFTDGSEVFIEEFKEERQALKYALGKPVKVGHGCKI